jgi:beta-lactamase superfamily II metal-dependent hydrolase
LKIYILDVGKTRLGDCILITHAGRVIMIDGAHPGDIDHIRDQLAAILPAALPFRIDLLVITHCHSDHIGCLPALVADGTIVVTTALVADEALGFGQAKTDELGELYAHLAPDERALVAAFQEEDWFNLTDAELMQFVTMARSLYEIYTSMLEQLQEQGTTVIRFDQNESRAAVAQLEREFADCGLRILGPTQEQLLACQEEIVSGTRQLAELVKYVVRGGIHSKADVARAYRRLSRLLSMEAAEAYSDRANPSAARNDQSMVIKVAADGWSALLTGDMQFADPMLPALEEMIPQLRRLVVDNGPYDFIKLPHHTSWNALDEFVLAEWRATRLFAHTGGWNDDKHPDSDVLDLLESNSDWLTFARTDRNELISIEKVDEIVRMLPKTGEMNDFTPNTRLSRFGAKSMRRIQQHAKPVDKTCEIVVKAPRDILRFVVTICVS